MGDEKQPIWKLIRACARELTMQGMTPFTRRDIIAFVQRTNPSCKRNTIDPMIQGLTDNLRGGVPGGGGKNLLHSVGRGRFVLKDPTPPNDDASGPRLGQKGTASSPVGPKATWLAASDEALPDRRPQLLRGPGRVRRAMVNVEANVQEYLGARDPGARYTSFDYCFNYFQSHNEQGHLAALLEGQALQLSCLHLGFYLASWGMMRGSAALFQRSLRQFVPVIAVIAEAPAAVWETDAHLYRDGKCPEILETASRIEAALSNDASQTLVTKIMLGTFGCLPAFDTFFKSGFGIARFEPKALKEIGEFYREHAEVIEESRVQTLEFNSGKPTDRRYTRAKVIDKIFFTEGRRRSVLKQKADRGRPPRTRS
jgi:hypothetical protein